MTPNEISTRCRKVFMTTQNNRIFWPVPYGFQEEAPVFVSEEKADDKTRHHTAKYMETYTRLQKQTEVTPDVQYKTVAFYLVPASKIDKP